MVIFPTCGTAKLPFSSLFPQISDFILVVLFPQILLITPCILFKILLRISKPYSRKQILIWATKPFWPLLFYPARMQNLWNILPLLSHDVKYIILIFLDLLYIQKLNQILFSNNPRPLLMSKDFLNNKPHCPHTTQFWPSESRFPWFPCLFEQQLQRAIMQY